jgi:hypothetical protein
VIKRIRFATSRHGLAPGAFAEAWRQAVGAAADAPDGARPSRIAACTALPDIIAGPKHDGIGLEWFSDVGHLARYEEWLGAAAARPLARQLEEAVELDASPVVIADELVLRGADWLTQRWQEVGEKLKHMAIARRAAGLTPEEFSDRWKGRAGTIQRPGEAVVIPDEARGKAYVQNHPRPGAAGGWAYDALNEVYFDDIGSLRARIDFFRENMTGQAEADLVSDAWFVAAREEVLLAGPGEPCTTS